MLLAMVVLGAGYTGWLDLHVRKQFEGQRWAVPARIFARPLELYAGRRLSADMLEEELVAARYQSRASVERPGTYRRDGDRFLIQTRRFGYWDGTQSAHRARVVLGGGQIRSLSEGAGTLALLRIDPAPIGRISPTHDEDRILVRLADVPRVLIRGLIAVEDRGFYRHWGISPRAMLRALWHDLRAGAAVEGGSTLTQQLAKNFFLTPDRTLTRKLNEVLIALILEARYDKNEILGAYLNEIFMGQQGGRAVHGFGLASEFYFGRPVSELRLPEVALLIALARGASYYNPRRHAQRAIERRNLVLSLLADRGVVSAAEAARAKRARLGVTRRPGSAASAHPAFVDLVRRQLRRDYRDEDLRARGLRIFTTMDPSVQARAEVALTSGLERLEHRRGISPDTLQGAMVLSNPHDGEVLAVVGGRRARSFGFNRALDAERPVGSIIKPAIYLTALEQASRYTLLSGIDDSPFGITMPGGEVWSPRNYDKRSHGTVPLYEALAHSYNQATVRLGMALGVTRVLDTLRRLGLQRELRAYPSVLLGAAALRPIEVAGIYQSLASGGFSMPLRAIREVTDGHGERLARYGLSGRQSVDPGPVFLVNRALIEAMRTGTGRAVRNRLGPRTVVAGKTGTTDDLRDSWFAGFDERRLAVVWVGRDDNKPVSLTGANGALQLWADLIARLGPESIKAVPPPDVQWHWADRMSGRRTDRGCRGAISMPFLRGSLPGYFECRLLSRGAMPNGERRGTHTKRSNDDEA